ncbi:MAG: Ribokinase-like protein [Piptocephalis tieghemiana]|nr:MAG: Ribokinase-like protein [Piptocephalis tieghemiana]
MACEQYGASSDVSILQFVGGTTGEYIRNVLDEKNIHHLTVLDTLCGDMTELIEPPAFVLPEERSKLVDMGTRLLNVRNKEKPAIEALALCGTFPGGVGGETYLELLNQAAPSTLVLLDAYKDVDCILETGRVDFFKINQEELVAITAKLPASVGPVDQSNIPSMARALLSHYHIRYFGVTDGPSTAHLFDGDTGEQWDFSLPQLTSLSSEIALLRKAALERGFKSSASPSASLPSPVGDHRELSFPPAIPNMSMSRGSLASSSSTAPIPSSSSSSSSSSLNPSSVTLTHNPSPFSSFLASASTPDGHTRNPPNPLGAGDTASAVLLVEYLRTKDPVQSFRKGLAAASASCLVTDQTGHFDIEIMHLIHREITVSSHKDASAF